MKYIDDYFSQEYIDYLKKLKNPDKKDETEKDTEIRRIETVQINPYFLLRYRKTHKF